MAETPRRLDRRTLLKTAGAGLGVAVFGAQYSETTKATSPHEAHPLSESEKIKRDPYHELVGIVGERTANVSLGIRFQNNGIGFEISHSSYDNGRGSVHVRVNTTDVDGYRFAGGFSINQDNLIPFGMVMQDEIFSGIDTREVHLYPSTPERQETSFQNAVALVDFVSANLPQE